MSAELIRQTSDLERRMRNQEALEQPKFTTTPEGNTTPVADSSGDIADGWLSSNVPLKNTANTFTATQSFANGAAINQTVPVGGTVTIPAGYAMAMPRKYRIDGRLTVAGRLRVW